MDSLIYRCLFAWIFFFSLIYPSLTLQTSFRRKKCIVSAQSLKVPKFPEAYFTKLRARGQDRDEEDEIQDLFKEQSFQPPSKNVAFDVKKIGLSPKSAQNASTVDSKELSASEFANYAQRFPGPESNLLKEVKAGAKKTQEVRKRLEALKSTRGAKPPPLKKQQKSFSKDFEVEDEEEDEYAEQDKLRREIVEEMRKLMPNNDTSESSGAGITSKDVGVEDISVFEKVEKSMEQSRQTLLAELEKALPSDLKEDLLYLAEADSKADVPQDEETSDYDSYSRLEKQRKQAEEKKLREKDILGKIDRQIDSLLSGEFAGWTRESPKPCMKLDHIDVVTTVLEALYDMHYPTDDHGSAVAARFTTRLKRFELLHPPKEEWRDLIRRSPTAKILTSRLQQSRFRILLDFERCKVTELALPDDSPNHQTVQVDLVDGVGREVQTNFVLKKSGGVWKVHCIDILKDSYYDFDPR